jgi:hypothetical protein
MRCFDVDAYFEASQDTRVSSVLYGVNSCTKTSPSRLQPLLYCLFLMSATYFVNRLPQCFNQLAITDVNSYVKQPAHPRWSETSTVSATLLPTSSPVGVTSNRKARQLTDSVDHTHGAIYIKAPFL